MKIPRVYHRNGADGNDNAGEDGYNDNDVDFLDNKVRIGAVANHNDEIDAGPD
ncbi:hypothetical protein DPMN_058847 [Dreissena polymorpha]|uniref:Uncharacterized protein n=1 Tax=Dreissena polymorpha TaxID=45954 RepID=A0A9D4C2Y5_DREPO|nr:hypothetical protein DPMN_058847 [Dreissena polymorpha]